LAAFHSNIIQELYGWVCGSELTANLLHFQFLPAHYSRRDILRDGVQFTGKLLDLGCGSQPYRPFLTNVAHYIGLDYPPTRDCLGSGARPEIHGDARAVPFADYSFDGVLCCQVLEHVDRPETVLREMGRVLKRGGVGLISIPFFYNLHMEPYDYFRFSSYGIRDLLARSGLKITRLSGQGGIGTCLVQTFHNWLFSGIARKVRRHWALKLLCTIAMPFLMLFAALNNLAALGLDRLNRHDLRFTPNLWVVVQKP
jgi:SAM-dependent methyltransferase